MKEDIIKFMQKLQFHINEPNYNFVAKYYDGFIKSGLNINQGNWNDYHYNLTIGKQT